MAFTEVFRHQFPLRGVVLVMTSIAVSLFLLVSCQSKLLYFPRDYPQGTAKAWEDQMGESGRILSYQTSEGHQSAFLQGELNQPRRLWIFCGGNATVALEWSQWVSDLTSSHDAWLLIDIPGYGNCEGSPTPKSIRESLNVVVPKACNEVGWEGPADPARLRFFGHSLGSAVVLMAASEFKIQKGVLLAPFTSTMEMARELTGLPVGFLVTHRYDNLQRINELTERGGGDVSIFHGLKDQVIPLHMGRKIASQDPSMIQLHVIDRAGHNNLHGMAADSIAAEFTRLSR